MVRTHRYELFIDGKAVADGKVTLEDWRGDGLIENAVIRDKLAVDLSVKAQCAILIFGEWCHPVLNVFVPQDGQALIKGDIRYGLDAREGSLPYRTPVEIVHI